jgi:hypothetical protein
MAPTKEDPRKTKVLDVVHMCMRDMPADYTGLLRIAGRIRLLFGSPSNEEVKQLSLAVVRVIIDRGLRPGDYLASGFKYWEGSNAEIVARIDRE